MEPIILASGSLRRREYFKLMGLPFSVLPAEIDESLCTQSDPHELTRELSEKKILKVLEEMKARPPKWICGADTIIAIGNKIYGKPKSRDEAASMLRELSDEKHSVITSIAIYNVRENKMDSRSVSCTVTFGSFSDAEIDWYLDTNEWQGVAGAYQIQGLASLFISKIEGSQSTVLGLPLHEFYVMLRDNGYPYGAN